MVIFVLPLIQFLLLFIRINNKEGNDSKILKGIFRIDSFYNNYCLTLKKKRLIFLKKKNSRGQKFNLIKNHNNKYYYIRAKGEI